MLISGVAMWAKVFPFNYDDHKKYGKKATMDLILTDENAEKLKSQGLTPKRNDKGEWVYRFKRKLKLASGADKPFPTVVDAKRNPITTPIGNGSSVVVQYTTYNWGDNKENVSADLQGVQVIHMVSAVAQDGEEFGIIDDGETATFEEESGGTTGDDAPF